MNDVKSEVKEEMENEKDEEGEKTMNDRNGENEETRDDTVIEMILRLNRMSSQMNRSKEIDFNEDEEMERRRIILEVRERERRRAYLIYIRR